MNGISLTGNDTITINNRVISDLANGDCAMLTFPNDSSEIETGKNGNAVYGLNESGKRGDLVLRVLRGSADDKYLNNLYSQQQANFSGFVLMFGEVIKKVGDGKGNITNDTYICSGGVFGKGVEAKTNVQGDVEQSVSIWTIKYAQAIRALT